MIVGLILLAVLAGIYFLAMPRGSNKEQAYGGCSTQYAKISEERKSDRYKDEFVIGCMKTAGYSMDLQNALCFSQGFSSSPQCFTSPSE
jgi:hypothetical protein